MGSVLHVRNGENGIEYVLIFIERHCEERSDEAIQNSAKSPWIATLPMVARNDEVKEK